ncbi:MAG: GGDEF domain-containing protein, partial [Myxococcales bacterium]|nr:GGDEF domain-containing protein [Myxococcales bacterium]
PLRTLESAARHLAEHRFDAPLPPAGDDELGSLTHSFATMRDALRAHELERSSAETRIRDLAYYDQLTGLPNRVFLHEYMERNLALARRHGRALALMYLDLDHFKRINDTLGHNAGDQLLKEASARLREVIRDSDCAARASRSGEVLSREDGRTVARFGGDEFLVVLTDIADATAASRVASRLLDRFSEPFALDSQELFVTTSIG